MPNHRFSSSFCSRNNNNNNNNVIPLKVNVVIRSFALRQVVCLRRRRLYRLAAAMLTFSVTPAVVSEVRKLALDIVSEFLMC